MTPEEYTKLSPSQKIGVIHSLGDKELEAEWGRAANLANPHLAAGAVINAFSTTWGKVRPDVVEPALQQNAEAIRRGDMGHLEAMLYSQAEALQAMFVDLARRATTHTKLQPYKEVLQLAFKAQAQSRATIEALGELKNPRSVVFAKQANVANQQQVNNGVAGAPNSRAEKSANPSNEVLTKDEHATLDISRAGETGTIDPSVEAVGKVDGSQDATGQNAERTKLP